LSKSTPPPVLELQIIRALDKADLELLILRRFATRGLLELRIPRDLRRDQATWNASFTEKLTREANKDGDLVKGAEMADGCGPNAVLYRLKCITMGKLSQQERIFLLVAIVIGGI
jgi:hypothetical protein